jgi:hypothetical protein
MMAWAGHCNELVLRTLGNAWAELSATTAGASWAQMPGVLGRFVYLHEDPLIVSLGVMLTVALATWLWSTVWRTAAAVDRLWSVVPGVYTAIMARDAVSRALAGRATPSDERQLVMLALALAWCCRWVQRLRLGRGAAAAPAVPQPEAVQPFPMRRARPPSPPAPARP